MISAIWMISDNLMYIYSIIWDSIGMICIVLKKKKLLYTTSFVAVVLKKNTDIIFKTAIGPAQSSIVSLKKQTVKQVASVSSC